MRPEDTRITSQPRGAVQPPDRSHEPAHAAVADLTRGQIDTIYSNQAADDAASDSTQAPQNDQATTDQTPTNHQSRPPTAYEKTHGSAHAVQADQWKHYHSAWQNYYQKYYEHYYIGAVHQVHQTYTEHAAKLQATQQVDITQVENETISTDEALYDLRSQLVSKVQESGKKVRSSRHFVPIVSAVAVLIIFGFLQYNRLIIANVKAYVSPGEIDPQNIIVDPSASLAVSKEPKLIIPKINVNVPVDYTAEPDQQSQLKSMENGVAYFGIPGANSKPGQIGNTVISGHSSNDYIDNGKYKFVFVQLERLKKDDVFYLHYKGIRYTYSITQTRVVAPTNVSSLVYKGSKPIVTLITCTPVGTAKDRLLVIAEQVSPDPARASAPNASSGSSKAPAMPGNSPTAIERIFGRD